jgi:mercuric reductase
MPETYTMPVSGMTCAHCERTVEAALEHAGASHASASFQRGEATFHQPDRADLSALADAVREAGYEPGRSESTRSGQIHARAGDDTYDYDLAIIGSGGAAFAAAIRATELDARVVMIERGTVGGTCVNIGCVPSKLLLRAGETYYHAAHHPYAGLETSANAVALPALIDQKRQLVNEMRQSKYLDLIGEYGWELRRGEARFIDAESIAVDGQPIRAGAYLIATGTRPAVPPIPGLEEAGYLTSTTAMELDALPGSIAVIGAGYIALEQGQIFRHLGSEVTLFQRGPRLLPDYAPEVSEAATAVLESLGTTLYASSRIEHIERTSTGKRIAFSHGGQEQYLDVDEVLVATGRQPNVEALNLEAAGIRVTGQGAIDVDATLRTSNPRVWAAGDVTLSPQFVYVAAYQGGLAARNALSGAGKASELVAVPSVVFTDPQVAAVGLTQAQAEHQGYSVKTSVLPLTAVPRAQVNVDQEGVVVLVADRDSNRLLGAQMVAANAGDAIYAATLAVKFGLTVTDLTESFAPYLTMSEGLKLAALAFDRDVAMLSCCAA